MISLTVLAENTARGVGILGEHGLAYWIDTGTHRVLFDTGQGLALLNNAAVLGIDLVHADAVVLSHGHFDHVGGLEAALAVARQAALYLHPRAVEHKFTGTSPATTRRISVPFVETEEFLHDERRVYASRKPVEVVPGIWATGEIPRLNDYEDTGGPFFLNRELTEPDPLLDDQSLFFNTSEGVVVVLGCAHAGVINTLDHVARLTGKDRIHTVLGGMHLENASPRRLQETFAALRRYDIQRLGPAHCTGWRVVARFQQEFPAHCFQCAAGSRFTWAVTPNLADEEP
jgi:7,8-dihydropterin-6-yl-methyl-4-(beta-D-ribofuranosyl)aminobenzene 5'-phosphate synthase